MLTIRPFDYGDDDYAAAVRIDNAIWPEYPSTIEEWRHNDASRDPKYLDKRFVAERDGEIVAIGQMGDVAWAYKEGKYHIGLSVDPAHQRQGIGSAFYRHLRELVAAYEPTLLVAGTREDQHAALRFLEKRGYRSVMRSPISELDLTTFDPAPFAGYAERVRERGIQIRSLAELMTEEPAWKMKYYDVHWEGLRDIPSPDPITRHSYEIFEKRSLGNPNFMPEGIFIAVDGDQWVGLSQLWKSQGRSDLLYTGLTGVARSHRRLGLAMAMKLRALDYATRYGVRRIETDNEENNPMFQINLRLGFEPRPAWLHFEKPLAERPARSDAVLSTASND